MPDVNEGIEVDTPGGGPDPNTEAGFAAALAHAVGKELPDDYVPALSSDVAAGLTYGTDRPGSAAVAPPAQADTGDEGGDDTPDEPEEVQDAPLHTDPLIASYLERYEGDSDKALRAAAELTSRFGQQGNELGDARERLARLEGEMTAMRQLASQPAPQPVSAEEIEAVQEAVEERGGRETVMRVLQTRPELYEHALEAWAEQSGKDALAAARFDTRYSAELAKAQAEIEAQHAGFQPDPDREYIANQRLSESMKNTLESVAATVPDWKAVAPFMTKALENVPRAIQLGVVGQSKELSQEEATKLVVSEARSLADVALRTATEGDKIEEGKRRRNAARVVTGSQRPVATGSKPLEEMSSEERIALFKQRLLSAETTSVADGLTYGK